MTQELRHTLLATAPEGAGSRVLRLLAVEDSDDDFQLLQMFLSKSGYQLDSLRVQNYAEMHRALASRDWQVVIADDRQPHFSAMAAIQLLQDLDLDLPFIVVSGEIDEDAAVAAMHAGADDFISKSRLSRLVPAIERSLRAAESRRLHRDAERSLKESNLKLQALSSNVPGMLVDFCFRNGSLQFHHVSEGSRSLFGLDPTDLIETPELLSRQFESQDYRSLINHLSRAGERSGVLRWEGRAREGDTHSRNRWLQLSASARIDDSMQIMWAGIVTDITALKRAEEDLATSQIELRALSVHLQQTLEHERTRMAREIHDSVGSTITALRADVSWLKHRLSQDSAIHDKLRYMDELIESAASATMRIVKDLRPAVLDFGFVSALEWLSSDFQKHSGIICEFLSNVEDVDMEPEHATAVFRIFQELLTNVAKHSQATKVRAHLTVDETALMLVLRDDGIGIPGPNRRRSESFGVRGMQERVRELGGTIVLQSAPEGGAVAVLRVPYQLSPHAQQP